MLLIFLLLLGVQARPQTEEDDTDPDVTVADINELDVTVADVTDLDGPVSGVTESDVTEVTLSEPANDETTEPNNEEVGNDAECNRNGQMYSTVFSDQVQP